MSVVVTVATHLILAAVFAAAGYALRHVQPAAVSDSGLSPIVQQALQAFEEAILGHVSSIGTGLFNPPVPPPVPPVKT